MLNPEKIAIIEESAKMIDAGIKKRDSIIEMLPQDIDGDREEISNRIMVTSILSMTGFAENGSIPPAEYFLESVDNMFEDLPDIENREAVLLTSLEAARDTLSKI